MKKFVSLFLAVLMLLSLAACGGAPAQPDTQATTAPVAPDESVTAEATLPESPANYLQISYNLGTEYFASVSAYDDGNGGICLDYQGQERKMTSMDKSVMEQVIQALEASGLVALNGQHRYGEELDSASMYVAFDDGSFLSAGFSGPLPQSFLDGYAYMEDFFKTLLADVPVYVPRPSFMEGMNETHQQQFEAILDTSGIEPLDMFLVNSFTRDEYFAMNLGLSTEEGIAAGSYCSPLMSATAYSCVIVTLEDGAATDAVVKDFLDDVAWNQWVCVSASHALVAGKDNMLLCLISSEELYLKTEAAIRETGWTILETAAAN